MNEKGARMWVMIYRGASGVGEPVILASVRSGTFTGTS
jgi:hypothetical protein